ncbi:hypothetical protein K488DRAFT_82252 [Vararia minispora EC-137]|uniref:Uncharacterized protein n=1 Tax=Vararia minispora EC-137 TaxID=1314806 RepID=A0ACB8QXN1_9AGAM|nr:hypothetical protein K488DRAFT_82252 [Vararia minispora EC-137]
MATDSFFRPDNPTSQSNPWFGLACERMKNIVSLDQSAGINSLLAEIKNAQEVLSLLRQSLNSRQSTAASLPPEILGIIFCALRDFLIDDVIEEVEHSWDSVLHVCRSWRTAAYDCLELWTLLYTETVPLRYWLEALSHTGQLPLHLILKNPHPIEPDIISQLVDQYGHRIKTLRLTDQHTKSTNFSQADHWSMCFIRQPLPALETLSLELPGTFNNDFPQRCFLEIAPSSLPPSLKSLHLVKAPFEWSSAIYDNLTELRFSNLPDYNTPSLEALAEILFRTHRLEDLEFSYVTFPAVSVSDITAPSSLRTVSFSYCWRLDLPTCFLPSPALHFFIDAPASTPSGTTAAYDYADPFLARHATSEWSSAPKKYEMVISCLPCVVKCECHGRLEVNIRTWRPHDDPTMPAVDIIIPTDAHPLVHSLIYSASLEGVDEAEFAFQFEPSCFSFGWLDLLSRSPQLHTLKLVDGAFEHFVAIPSEAYPKWEQREGNGEPLPALRAVVIEVTEKFAQSLKKREDPVLKLATWLNLRKDRALEIQRLTISACLVESASTRSDLEAAVSRVEYMPSRTV